MAAYYRLVVKATDSEPYFSPILYLNSDCSNSKFAIYPNPTRDILNIEVGTYLKGSFAITNSHGKVVKDGQLTGSSIDVNELASGVYILFITTDGQTQTAKFIKE